MRLGVVDDGQSTLPDGRAAPAAGAHRRRAGQGRRRPAGPLRQVLPPDPGRPDRRASSPAARASPSTSRSCPTVAQRARGQPRSSRSSGRRRRPQTYPIAIRVEAYDRTGLLSDITQVVAENKVNILAAHVGVHARPHGRRDRDAPGRIGVAAGPGHEPDRDSSRTSSASSATSARPTPRCSDRVRRSVRAARATCCPTETPAWTRLERLAADLAARYGYRRDRDPDVRADRRLRARRRRGHRHRREGAVPDRAADGGRRVVGAPARSRRPGIVRAYVQHGMQTLAAAGEADR